MDHTPRILMACSECYPVAKVGGMADVVGALPKYLVRCGVTPTVVMPRYDLPWFYEHEHELIHEGYLQFPHTVHPFRVIRYAPEVLGFELIAIDLPGLFDRASVYLDSNGEGYRDEPLRNISFQRAILQWWNTDPDRYDLLHCHDHMTGLMPFLMRYAYAYQGLSAKSVFFTIHNALHRGRLSWSVVSLLPHFDTWKSGLLEWDEAIDSLASALRCSDRINTVSPGYLEELPAASQGLEWIFQHESHKMIGLLNGVDYEVWNPSTDKYLAYHKKKSLEQFKKKNKEALIGSFATPGLPLFIFIGRFAHQKGVDVMLRAIHEHLLVRQDANFLILGSGDKDLEYQAQTLARTHSAHVSALVDYNEKLSHIMYAGADFLLMPSRVEPCGLNQMFSMRYGTVPVVHHTGGLKDTVPDITVDGNGISFNSVTTGDIMHAMHRSLELYADQAAMKALRSKISEIDLSWDASAEAYAQEYKSLLSRT